jgi:hypothetical protein
MGDSAAQALDCSIFRQDAGSTLRRAVGRTTRQRITFQLMSALIFKVAQTFSIEGRGVVVTPVEWGTGTARVGDTIVLRRPDGSSLQTKLKDIGYPRCELLLPLEIKVEHVPPGTEIWTANN